MKVSIQFLCYQNDPHALETYPKLFIIISSPSINHKFLMKFKPKWGMKVTWFSEKYYLCVKIQGNLYWTFFMWCLCHNLVDQVWQAGNIISFSEEQLSHWQDKHQTSDKNDILPRLIRLNRIVNMLQNLSVKWCNCLSYITEYADTNWKNIA